MGNTCSSVHIALTGTTADAIESIVRAYLTLGFERTTTAPPERGKHVILFRKEGDAFLSVYDSDNAALDTGELKDLALAASKIMKTAAVFTSLYDSDEGQSTLDACRAYLEAWLRPLAEQTGEVTIHTEKRMTPRAYVGKSRKTLRVSAFQRDKTWQKLFDTAGNYQTVLATLFPNGAEYPIAGVGLQVGMEQYPEHRREHYEQQLADTLSQMRGRPFDRAPVVNTVHVFNWVLNHADCYRYLGTSNDDMKDRIDEFAAHHPVLQAWHSQCTWQPLFDHADDYHRTVYEEHSVLNWFRGILPTDGGLNASKMSLQWCRNVVRMVTPHMWICGALLQQVDRAALDAVAQVTGTNDAFKIALREGQRLDDLELALLPVLPVESVRVQKR